MNMSEEIAKVLDRALEIKGGEGETERGCADGRRSAVDGLREAVRKMTEAVRKGQGTVEGFGTVG